MEACRNGNSRYQNTIKPSLERLGGRQPLGISGGKVDDQAEHGLVRERTMADSEAPDLDQTGQLPHRTHPQLFAGCVEMDTVIPHQNGRRQGSGAPGENQIEGQARLAGARRAADQHRTLADQNGGCVHA